MNLDFSFYTWDLIGSYVLKGLYFSVFLSHVDAYGRTELGGVLALIR